MAPRSKTLRAARYMKWDERSAGQSGLHSFLDKEVAMADKDSRPSAGSRLLLAIPVIGLIIGLSILAYPIAADWITTWQADHVVQTITSEAGDTLTDEQAAALDQADLYNQELAGKPTDEDVLPYDQQLNLDSSGVMCTISIPKINVNLPVYHGTGDSALASGVGHIQGTSLPVGGDSTHAVLSGHSGMQTSRMFDDIRELQNGDTFTILVFNRKLVYEVYDIEVVLPDETSSFATQPGEDLCTLVTCTPYGVNDHRLLVHARRTSDTEEEPTPAPAQYVNRRTGPFLAAMALIVAAFVISRIIQKRRRAKAAGTENASAITSSEKPAKARRARKKTEGIGPRLQKTAQPIRASRQPFFLRRMPLGTAAAALALVAGITIAATGAALILSDVSTEQGYQQLSVNEKSDEVVATTDGASGKEIDWDALKSENPDTAAWIQLPGTVIDYPVMQASDENPHYYLRHDFWHKRSLGGNPYIDHRCTADGQQIIVYGHHMGSIGTMFTPLYDCYEQYSFDETLANVNLLWSTPDGGTTQLHAICAKRTDDEYATMQQFEFDSSIDFREWLRTMVNESDAQYSDWETRAATATRAITLVTCSSLWSGSNARTVVLFVGN